MTQETKRFTVADPRSFDGDPYEVAARACEQAASVARILSWCIEGANIMARNAEMERALIDGDDARAAEWDESPQGKRIAQLRDTAGKIEKNMRVVGKAASFNPKAKVPSE